MLLEEIVKIVAPLIVEVEVLALRFTFGAHHFSDGRPVSAVLNQPWWIETQVTFYNSWKKVQGLNSLLMHGVNGTGINPSQSARARWRNSRGLQPSHISLIWHRHTQQFTAHISRKGICCIQFNTTIPLNYLYRLMSGSISLIKIVRLANLSLCFFQLELLWTVGGFKEQPSGDMGSDL